MDSRTQRVMIVDDADLVRRYCREILEAAGYEVEEALNGIEALEKLLVEPADLLIVDVNMPRMDGMTFLSTLRAHSLPISAIPAVVISTESGVQDRAAARAAGANFYLVKPVTRDVLTGIATLLCGPPP
jgi:two-component system chemotaxis response regulator CheY